MSASYARDHQTAREKAGVRVPPIWPHARVHAFRRWESQATLLTWCGVAADLQDGSEQTTALITCGDCAKASLQAF